MSPLYQPIFSFFSSNSCYARAKYLCESLKDIETKEEIKKILNDQAKDNFYYEELERHHNRF
jgi:hypothetical protein